MKKTVAIVGRAKETRALAPFGDTSKDIWAFNYYAYSGCPRVTGVFEMHPDALHCDRYDEGYLKWLGEEHDFPIWTHPMLNQWEGIPAAQRFPIEAITERFEHGIWRGDEEVKDFYTSSPAFALALAMYQDYQRIEVYGIEMNPLTPYAQQANCWYFWMGKASALGYEIFIHPASRLFDEPLYPFKRKP